MSKSTLSCFVLAGVMLALASCIEPILPAEFRGTYGWVPIQVPEAQLRAVRLIRPPESGARINIGDIFDRDEVSLDLGDLRFRKDSLQGFDLFRTRGGTITQGLGFWYVPGLTDMRVNADGQLEVNNLADRITFTVVEEGLRFLRRDTDALTFTFPQGVPDVIPPSPANPSPAIAEVRYFGCPDAGRGVLLGWRTSYSTDLDCYLTE